MAQTNNYHLSLYQPFDRVKAGAFNENLTKIDTALKGVANTASTGISAAQTLANRALSQLEMQGYNLYNLLLQHDYEGKYTGYARALLFDGFANEDRIASKPDALDIAENRAVLWGTKITTLGETEAGNLTDSLGHVNTTAEYQVDRKLEVSRFTFWLQYASSSASTMQTTVTLQRNKTTVQQVPVTIPLGSTARTLSAAFTALTVQPGDTLSVVLSSPGGTANVSINQNKKIIGYFTVRSWNASSAKITGNPVTLTKAPASALAWVRHSSGSVSITLNNKSMTSKGTKTTTTVTGTACTETSFQLNTALTTTVTPAVTLNGIGATATYLYDYGVIFF